MTKLDWSKFDKEKSKGLFLFRPKFEFIWNFNVFPREGKWQQSR